ncbi:MAG: GNAT family N-acetyltransferase [Acidimicrobiia bacterium]
MPSPHETTLTGLDYLEAVTRLLQRIRRADAASGLWEAADRQWSWRNPRPTDEVPQLFWFSDGGEPEAAVILTTVGTVVAFDPILMPDASHEFALHVVSRGIEHATENGLDTLELESDRDDATFREILLGNGFKVTEDGVVEAWLSSSALPEISSLSDGYQLMSRSETQGRPHHMISEKRKQADVEPRLQQTSLYSADLDLVVYDENDNVAAYGLFWYDPTTKTGLVEPMRTEDDHQRRGLARHVLTAGVHRLAAAGAERIKIVYESGNPASSHLYRDVGFEPQRHTEILSRSANDELGNA